MSRAETIIERYKAAYRKLYGRELDVVRRGSWFLVSGCSTYRLYQIQTATAELERRFKEKNQ